MRQLPANSGPGPLSLTPRNIPRVRGGRHPSRPRSIGYAWADNKYSEQRSKESILKYHLVPAFGELPLSDITTDAIGGYVAAKLKGGRVESQNAPKAMRGKGLSKKTVNNHLTVLHKCLDMAVPKWLKHPLAFGG